MIGLIIILTLAFLLFFIIRSYIDIHANILMLKKSSKVAEKSSDLENHFIAIKDLY